MTIHEALSNKWDEFWDWYERELEPQLTEEQSNIATQIMKRTEKRYCPPLAVLVESNELRLNWQFPQWEYHIDIAKSGRADCTRIPDTCLSVQRVTE